MQASLVQQIEGVSRKKIQKKKGPKTERQNPSTREQRKMQTAVPDA